MESLSKTKENIKRALLKKSAKLLNPEGKLSGYGEVAQAYKTFVPRFRGHFPELKTNFYQ
jgi:hypothetical protein